MMRLRIVAVPTCRAAVFKKSELAPAKLTPPAVGSLPPTGAGRCWQQARDPGAAVIHNPAPRPVLLSFAIIQQ